MVPGANVFIATEDVTSDPLPDGSHTIKCVPISDTKGGRLAYQGLNILRRLLAGVPV